MTLMRSAVRFTANEMRIRIGKDLVVDPLTEEEKEKLLQLLTVNTM